MTPNDHTNAQAATGITVGEAVTTAKAVRFGAPGRCPQCGEPGFLDYVDMKRGISDSSCRACGIAWNFTRAEDGTAVLVAS